MSSPSPTRRASGARPPWRRTLLVAFGAQTLALMGFTLIFPFLPLYIQTLGVNAPLQALVTTVTPRAEMGRSMGLMLAGIFTGVALGPLAGGVLNDHLGFRGTFACSAGLLLAAALLVLCGIEERFVRPAPARGQSVLTPFKTFLAVAVSPGLLLMALVLFMVQTSSMTPAPVLPLFVPQLQGVPVVQ